MSTLQNELMQSTNGLSDDSLKIILDFVRKFIVPYDRKNETVTMTVTKPRTIGNRKGVKFFADGHDIDDYNDEIEEMFGVND